MPTAAIMAALILLNAGDVALHVAVDRIEPIRVTANVLVVTAALLAAFQPRTKLPALLAAGAAHVLLNGYFIAVHGIGPVGAVLVTATLLLLPGAAFGRPLEKTVSGQITVEPPGEA